MQYRLVRVIGGKGAAPAQFAETLCGLAVGAGDLLYAVGDRTVKVFAPDGTLQRSWGTARPGLCVAVGADGNVYVGETRQIEVFDKTGRLLRTWTDERIVLPSAIGMLAEEAAARKDPPPTPSLGGRGLGGILVADLKDRCIRRFDERGNFVNDIGRDNKTNGFLIPNGHLDFAVAPDGVIHAANPGKHRVERYRPTGELLGHFGRFDSRDPAGFTGCCNPTNVALLPGGEVAVTEKAGPRAKVYDAEGKLLTVIDGAAFDPACKNMDIAVDSRGSIYVADTVKLHACVFEPDAPASRPESAPTGSADKRAAP